MCVWCVFTSCILPIASHLQTDCAIYVNPSLTLRKSTNKCWVKHFWVVLGLVELIPIDFWQFYTAESVASHVSCPWIGCSAANSFWIGGSAANSDRIGCQPHLMPLLLFRKLCIKEYSFDSFSFCTSWKSRKISE